MTIEARSWTRPEAVSFNRLPMTTFLRDEATGERAIAEITRTAFAYFSRLARADTEGRLLDPP